MTDSSHINSANRLSSCVY